MGTAIPGFRDAQELGGGGPVDIAVRIERPILSWSLIRLPYRHKNECCAALLNRSTTKLDTSSWVLISLDRLPRLYGRFFLNRRSLPVPCHEFWTRSSSADDSMPGEFCSELLNRFSSFVSPSFVPRSEPAASCGDSSSTGSGRARCKRYRVLPGRHGQQ